MIGRNVIREPLFSNYVVFKKDNDTLDVLDVTSCNVLVQFKYDQKKFQPHLILKTKEGMTAVVLIIDDDNFKYIAIDFLKGNSRTLASFDKKTYYECLPPIVEEIEVDGKVKEIVVRATIRRKERGLFDVTEDLTITLKE